MTSPDIDRQAHLITLAAAAGWLSDAVKAYQLTITAARASGATWRELGTALDLNWQTARKRHDSARDGGELHIKLPPLKDLLEEQDGKSNSVR